MKNISLMFILGMLFVLLKVTHVIDWSWFWVCSPFILEGAVIVTGIMLIKALGPETVKQLIEEYTKKKGG